LNPHTASFTKAIQLGSRSEHSHLAGYPENGQALFQNGALYQLPLNAIIIIGFSMPFLGLGALSTSRQRQGY
jgi:hypothetical protein